MILILHGGFCLLDGLRLNQFTAHESRQQIRMASPELRSDYEALPIVTTLPLFIAPLKSLPTILR